MSQNSSRVSSSDRQQNEDKTFKSNKFYEEKRQLNNFLTQLKIHFRLTSIYETKKRKILYAISHFRKTALNWIDSLLRDYFENSSQRQKSTTRITFASYDEFRHIVRETFEDIDERALAEKKLESLKQLDSIAIYNRLFQQHVYIAEWNDNALTAKYYAGLNDEVKYVIAIRERSEDFNNMRTLATELANSIYEQKSRYRERAFFRIYLRSNINESQLMNLNDLKQTKNIKCYNYEKKRHKKKDCTTSTLDALEVLKDTTEHVKSDKDLDVLVNIWISHSQMS